MMNRFPFLKVAKVTAVHRNNHSVDIVMLDGIAVRNVPVLGFGGSNHGFAGLVSPSIDKTNPARKTYPDPTGEVRHPATHNGRGRDEYVVVVQLEGSHHGASGLIALGFLYPQVSEMMFDEQTPDLMVYRHPSDVQVTIDKDGKTSVQHPAGARVTIGTDFGPVDLEGKDTDKLYRLRNNLGAKVGIQMKDTAESSITLDHEGNIAVVAPKNVTVDAGENIHATAGENITADAGENIEATAGGDITAEADGNITAKAGGDAKVQAGGDLEAKAGGDAKVQAGGNGTYKAGGTLTLKGQLVQIN